MATQPEPTTKRTKGVHLWLLPWKAMKTQEAHARVSVEATGLCLGDVGVLEAPLHKCPLRVNTLGKKILISTAKGDELVRRLLAEHARDMEQAFSCLDEPEKEALAALLRRAGSQADGPAPLDRNTLSSRKRGES